MKPRKKPTEAHELPASIPYTEDVSILSSPIALGAHTVQNRICYQPMEGCDGTRDGSPDELTVRRYLRFAEGGAGLIWFEATAIVPEGRANPRQLYLTENNVRHFAALIESIKQTCLAKNGFLPVIVCQLTHSGRWSKPDGVPAPRIAYNKPIFEGSNPIPASAIVTDEYLDALVERYVTSARLAKMAGFDGVDIKACHGYLLSELLNAYLRPGKYGGSFENRTRLFLDTVEAVRAALPSDFIVGSRFNAYDAYPHPYGFCDSGVAGVPDLTEAKLLAAELDRRGTTLLNVTMGCPYTNHEVNRPTAFAVEEEPYRSIERMLEGAREVTNAAPNALVVASGVTYLGALAPNVAAAGIANGDYHLVGFGRQTFSYPNLAKDIVTKGHMERDQLCMTCGKCTQLMRNGKTPGCVIFDKEVYLPLYKEIMQ